MVGKWISVMLVTLLVASCGDTTGTTMAAPEQIILYSGRNENFVEPLIDAFTAATGIEVVVRYGDGTSDLAAILLNEGDATDADLFWAQDPAWIGAIGDAGLLSTLPSDVLDLVDPAYRDGDGEWVGVTARSRVMVYNRDLVSAEELPDTVTELTDPVWRGRIGIAPTNASFVAFVSAMELVDGPEATLAWLEGMAANDVATFSGNGAIVNAVIAGDLDAGLVNHYYLLQAMAERGEVPASNHFLAAGDPGSLVMATGVGVLHPSDHKQAAVEFIRYLLSEDAQAHFVVDLFEYGLIEGAPTPEGQLELDSSVDLIARAGLS
jgi:iron(III) transport system substrate-binding protein